MIIPYYSIPFPSKNVSLGGELTKLQNQQTQFWDKAIGKLVTKRSRANNVDVQSVGDDMVKPWLSNVIQEGRTPPIRFVEHMMESNEQCPVIAG
jgi:hypothetical protein